MPDETGFLLESFKRAEDTENTDIWWLVKLDNLNTKMSLATLPNSQRAIIWSPTGTAIAVLDRGAWGGGVTLVYADGSGCEDLPIPGFVMESPSISWSPDGQKIAYTYVPYPEGLDAAEVRIIDVSTYQTTTVYADGGLPEWFPNGEAIALFGWQKVIPVIRADGSGLIGEIEVPDEYMVRGRGTWSPDGSRLALYLKVQGPDYEPVAIGILDRKTLIISVFEAPYFSEILGWTSDGKAVVVLAHEGEKDVLRKVSVGH